jgi:hypothetical protein
MASTTEGRSSAVPSDGPASLRQTVTFPVNSLNCHVTSSMAILRGNTEIAALLRIFTSVVVTRVEMFVYQSFVPVVEPGSDGYAPFLVRFGIVPRNQALSDDSGGCVVNSVPHLVDLVTSHSQSSSARVAWGEGATPFPPGLQLDLRLIEERNEYASPIILISNPLPKSEPTHDVVAAQLNVTVSCSGRGFGGPV